MQDTTLFVGMDVHKASISISVVDEQGGRFRPTVTLANDSAQLRRWFGRLQKEGALRVCYEAGSCGYEVQRLLTKMGISCDVIAPALIPVRPGDQVKTDRLDAEKLARLYRAGELTSIRVPNETEEAARDLCRCREDIREDVTRERHRLAKLLLRHGRVFAAAGTWSKAHWKWMHAQSFEEGAAQATLVEYRSRLEESLRRLLALDQQLVALAAQEPFKGQVSKLRCLRGIETLSALILVTEICDFRRFKRPKELMAYLGLVPGEHSSGGRSRRGGITKTGNAHARKALIEAAWHYHHPPRQSDAIKKRWKDQPEAVVAHAWKAQQRLHRRFVRLTSRGKPSQLAAVAVARELSGFVWAIANA